jgi:hypothetical protein
MPSNGQSSQHLAASRRLLNEIEAETASQGADMQTKATVAATHAILVLAEQVAVARVVMATEAVQRTQPAPAPAPQS